MGLVFPNACRSFDERRDRVCFWGHDSAIEISFYVEREALEKLDPATAGEEDGCLAVFDATRAHIHAVAERLYRRGDKGTYAYVLRADDF